MNLETKEQLQGGNFNYYVYGRVSLSKIHGIKNQVMQVSNPASADWGNSKGVRS